VLNSLELIAASCRSKLSHIYSTVLSKIYSMDIISIANTFREDAKVLAGRFESMHPWNLGEISN
jgi:hypothetical protein